MHTSSVSLLDLGQHAVDITDGIVMLRLRPDDFEFLAGTSQRLPVTRQIQRLPDSLGD